jgi:putative tryptophan/tyrosine transport system substrate-binding protein
MKDDRSNRREVLTGMAATAGAAALPRGAGAQAQTAMLRVGGGSPQPRSRSFLQGFDVRMRELGYVEGQNYTMDYFDLQGRIERYSDAMQQLVDRKPDVIVAFGPEESLKAALAATRTIPIVMAAIDYDPIALGYVTSLARPTGNVTGIFLEQIELAAKRLQLVKDAFPAINKAMVLWDQQSADQWRATRDNAAKFGFDLAGIELRDYPYDYARALAQAPPDHRGFLFAMTSPLFARDRDRLVQFTLLNRLPSMFVFREYVAGRARVLRAEPQRDVAAHRRLRPPHRARGQAIRPADRAADDFRAGHQPAHCQGARAGVFASHAAARRRGD